MNSEQYQTSFDVELTPNVYYVEIYGYEQEGIVKVIVYDDCKNDIVRPHMYDDDLYDAFGHKKNILTKLDLYNCGCTLQTDATLQYEKDPYVLIDGRTDAGFLHENSLMMSDIRNFTFIQINFAIPRKLQLIKLFGNPTFADAIRSNSVVLQGQVNGNWHNIEVLKTQTKATLSKNDWIINHRIINTSACLSYKIQCSYRHLYHSATEMELYE